LEANACRAAVIATGIEGTNEIVHDGVTGLLVIPEDFEDLSKKIGCLIINKQLRENLIQNAYENVQKFAWDKALDQLVRTLEVTIDNSK
jgi:glycosyltransferase involved in cell wall biosynthesis